LFDEVSENWFETLNLWELGTQLIECCVTMTTKGHSQSNCNDLVLLTQFVGPFALIDKLPFIL
jgi:hypothetical protein